MVLAKEMIQSKRAVTKLYASKAQMNSVLLSMKNQLGEFGSPASVETGTFIYFILCEILCCQQFALLSYNLLFCTVSEGNVFVCF